VSGAGATQSDIEAGAANALEEDISTLSPASNSVADNLDGGVAAVDWSNKTPKVVSINEVNLDGSQQVNVTGSGFVVGVSVAGHEGQSDGTIEVSLSIDGTNLGIIAGGQGGEISDQYGPSGSGLGLLHRFGSSFNVTASTSGSADVIVGIAHVID